MSSPIGPTTTKGLRSFIGKAFINDEAKKKVDKRYLDLNLSLCCLDDTNVKHLKNPFFKSLVKWLSDPSRTVEQFNYFLYRMVHSDYEVENYLAFMRMYKNLEFPVYLGKMAIEALAVKQPIIEGSWELTAWAVLSLTELYDPEEFGWASDTLSEWITKMESDPSLCPNSHLRLEFMNQVKDMVQKQQN